MAKKLVKKAAAAAAKKPVKRPAKAMAKPAHVSVKPSAKSAALKSKHPVSKVAATKSKPLNGKVVPSTAKPIAEKKSSVLSKSAKPIVAAKAVAVAAKATGTSARSAAPVPAHTKNNVAKAVEPVKSGRPMLLQGPIAVRPMGKKATLVMTPEKPKAKVIKRRLPLNSEPSFVVVQPPTKAVATSEKAAKNKAGLNQKDLDFFRDLLLAKRRELVGDMSSMEREALRENSTDLSNLPVHMADQGTDAYEQEFTLHLVEKDRTLLRELNDALAKIQNGTYGICEGTGLPISKPRLEAQPWARHSIEHARALEKRQMMFRR